MSRGYASLLLAAWALVVLCACSSARAAGQGWEIVGSFAPTNLAPGGTGTLDLYVYDTGSVPSEGPVTVTDKLPEGVQATGGAGCVGTQEVACELPETATGVAPVLVKIPVSVKGNVPAGSEVVDRAAVSGGGASGEASTSIPIKFSSTSTGLGLSIFDGWFSEADGAVDTQAGSHPYELTLALGFNNDGTSPAGGEPHELNLDLPSGLIFDGRAVPQCERAVFDAQEGGLFLPGECAPSTVIGEDTMTVAGHGPVTVPVYNLQPPPGVMAELAFGAYSTHTIVDLGVRDDGSYGVLAHMGKVPQLHVLFDSLTLWGVPAEESHNLGRASNAANTVPAALLTLPPSCGSPPVFTAEILDTWEDANAAGTASFPGHDEAQAPIGLTGCDHLGFAPTMTAAPDTSHGDTPAGLTAEINALQETLSDPANLSVADLHNTTITLPQGVVVNPGFANALQTCQPSEARLESEGPPTCPASSKIGEVEIEMPLVKSDLTGTMYILASQPPNLRLLASASGDGIDLKLQGTLHLNEATGQPTLTLEQMPQLPFSAVRVIFDGGAQAALVTPALCGLYATSADLESSGSPLLQDVFDSKTFAIESGPGGAPCTSQLPFAPSLSAGSSTDQAGGSVGFSMLLERGDGQQRISSMQLKLPPGVSGMFSKVALCGEPQAGAGDCPEASQVGHVTFGAGPGPYPLFIPQAGQPSPAIYLTGPYQGAPFGLSIVLPLIAGPFDLGTEVVRARIEVDPGTGQLSVVTGSLPRIAGGIPLDLRTLSLDLDRPGFMFNPTNCDPNSVTGVVSSFEGATVPVESHFQVGSCQALRFEPHLSLSTQAKTSKAHGASLTAKILYPNLPASAGNEAEAQANIQTLKLQLPKRLSFRRSTIALACPASVFEAAATSCPAASVVGHAIALTPMLSAQLTGSVYYVAHAGQALPSIDAVLQGAGVTLDLTGSATSSKGAVSAIAFSQMPDIPTSLLEVSLPEGAHSALAASGSLCKGKSVAPTELGGQNGALIKQSTKLEVGGCPKAKAAKTKKKGDRAKAKVRKRGRSGA
jgi:hypothetical protein